MLRLFATKDWLLSLFELHIFVWLSYIIYVYFVLDKDFDSIKNLIQWKTNNCFHSTENTFTFRTLISLFCKCIFKYYKGCVNIVNLYYCVITYEFEDMILCVFYVRQTGTQSYKMGKDIMCCNINIVKLPIARSVNTLRIKR